MSRYEEDDIDSFGWFVVMGIAMLAFVVSLVIGLWAWWLA